MYVSMKKASKLALIIAFFMYCFAGFAPLSNPVDAQFYPDPGDTFVRTGGAQDFFTPKPCTSGQGDKPSSQRSGSYCPDLCKSDPNTKQTQCTYACANSYEEWIDDPNLNFWVEDPDVTALGKGGERSRQFLLWTLTHPSIDNHPVLLEIWQLSESVALFMILLVVIVMGIGIIIGQRNNFNLRIEIWPLIIRIALLLLFVVFSARIVLVIIQLSDVMMEFFIRTLGVRELFNIFFVDAQSGNVIQASETAYREFIGCSNWNAANTEMVSTSKFLVRFTNMTYYFFGIMMILRKVILWFLMVVAPFLAILAPFVFIRNIGWIWVGVFFQWIFYGPLMALFLGALAKIWNNPDHIPFVFDFSRIHDAAEAVYPTSINILYGGPAQTLGIWNTSNYVDTFAEYVISLIMLWTVLILPWWLLRIFRDYCCDGIYAMKNILLSMYDTMRTGGGPGPKPGPAPTPRPTGTAGLALDLPTEVKVKAKIDIPNLNTLKKVQTEEIVKSVQMKASNITEIANIETNKVSRENIQRNINEIQNPMRAQNSEDRQKLTDLRDEIRKRAARGDKSAQRFNSIANRSQQQVAKQQILSSMPKLVPVVENIAVRHRITREKAQNIVNKVFTNVAVSDELVGAISASTKVSADKTRQVLKAVGRGDQGDKPPAVQIQKASMETGVEEAKVRAVIKETAVRVKARKEVTQQIAQTEQVEENVVENVVQETIPAVSEPEKNIEQIIPSSSPKVKIEEYEQVKSMWQNQYEKGEVPVTENIKDRAEWVEGDVVRITNILNKVTSQDKTLQEQGLDEVGYILPVFMVNNLSGEELLVYLKAKLEAAKQVERDIKKEEELREKIEQENEEDLVEVAAVGKKEEAKTKTLKRSLELETPEEEASDSEETPDEDAQPDSDVAAPSMGSPKEPVEESTEVPQTSEEPSPLDEVKRKLEAETQEVPQTSQNPDDDLS